MSDPTDLRYMMAEAITPGSLATDGEEFALAAADRVLSLLSAHDLEIRAVAERPVVPTEQGAPYRRCGRTIERPETSADGKVPPNPPPPVVPTKGTVHAIGSCGHHWLTSCEDHAPVPTTREPTTEQVEAAAEALCVDGKKGSLGWENVGDFIQNYWRQKARLALRAALGVPTTREATARVRTELYDDFGNPPPTTTEGGHMSTDTQFVEISSQYLSDLEARIAALESGFTNVGPDPEPMTVAEQLADLRRQVNELRGE